MHCTYTTTSHFTCCTALVLTFQSCGLTPQCTYFSLAPMHCNALFAFNYNLFQCTAMHSIRSKCNQSVKMCTTHAAHCSALHTAQHVSLIICRALCYTVRWLHSYEEHRGVTMKNEQIQIHIHKPIQVNSALKYSAQ